MHDSYESLASYQVRSEGLLVGLFHGPSLRVKTPGRFPGTRPLTLKFVGAEKGV